MKIKEAPSKMLKTTMVKTIDVSDWDILVADTYGRPYNFQQQGGCKGRGTEPLTIASEGAYDDENDTIPEVVNGNDMGVSFAAWLARDPKQKLKENDPDYRLTMFWERSFYPSAEVIAQDLLARGLVEAGEYVIDIDW